MKKNNKKRDSNIITVQNAEGDANTKAEIVVQNQINYAPKVSVIIPVYNVEQYLRQCLDSVVNQTLREIEIICVDDGSTDSSLDILKEYAAKDKRVTVLKQENLHAGVARNAGLAVAKGEYIHFLDSDDYVKTSFYSKMIKFATTHKVDVISCSWANYNESNVYFFKDLNSCKLRKNGDFDLSIENLKSINVEVWNKLFRHNIIQKYTVRFPSTIYGEDAAFCTQYLICSKTAFGSIENLYTHYIRENSLIAQKYNSRFDFSSLEGHIKTYDFIKYHNLDKPRNISYFLHRVESGFLWLRNNFYKTAKEQSLLFENYTKMLQQIDDIWIAKNKTLQLLKTKQYDSLYVLPLSVIIPVYNSEKFLAQCLNSVLSQSMQNIEVICINDGSSDDSLKILQDYAKKDDRVIILDKENSGAGDSRNQGLKIAHGKYVYFMDSDDWIEKTTLEKVYLLAVTENADVVKFKSNVYDEIQKKIVPNKFFSLKNIDGNLYEKPLSIQDTKKILTLPNTPWSGVYKRKFLLDNNIHYNTLKCVNDVSFFIHCMIAAERVVISPLTVLNYRINNESSLIGNKINYLDCLFESFKIIEKIIKKYSSEIRVAVRSILLSDIICWLDKYFLMKLDEGFRKHLITETQNFFEYIKKHQICSTEKLRTFQHKLTIWANPRNVYADNLIKWYEKGHLKKLDLDNPQTFNEKIQWLKLYDSTPIKTRLADKFAVRDWIKEKIGEQYLIPLLGVYNKAEEIDFDKLPKQFVIKCNHSSHQNIVVKNKSALNLDKVKTELDTWLTENYAYHAGMELHYRDIKPKIIIEKYIENTGGELYDYKFWCFGGKVKYIQFLSERSNDGFKMAFYDTNWRKQKFIYNTNWQEDDFVADNHRTLDDKNMKKPDNLEQMIALAEKLAHNFNYVRVDFYHLNDNTVYFGEMTFTPVSGKIHWSDEKINQEFGALITLPEMAYNIDTGEYYKLLSNFHKKLFKTNLMNIPLEKKPQIQIKKVAKKTPPKSIISYDLFHFIPFCTYKKRGGNQVWKIFGIPVWRIRKMENTHSVKCYLFGLPFVKICNEIIKPESEYVSLD